MELGASDYQIKKLHQDLAIGVPLQIALKHAKIKASIYYYWVALASVVVYMKDVKEIKDQADEGGVNISQIREAISQSLPESEKEISAYIEPSGASLLNYQNSENYRKLCQECYEIVLKCDEMRSSAFVHHLLTIYKAGEEGAKIDPNAAKWFLERTMPQEFGKTEVEIPTTEKKSIKVEFVDPSSAKDRIEQMEREILSGKYSS